VNFALILFILVIVTGVLFFLNRRRKKNMTTPEGKKPWWVEWGAELFPIFLIVFLLRSFLVEPYRIPSGSMLPTLEIGDFILVNKYNYGIRLPIINKKIFAIGEPQRGDVVVFRWPVNPEIDYIKRVVGLPGDQVDYYGKQLHINSKTVATISAGNHIDDKSQILTPRYRETLDKVEHDILVDPVAPDYVSQQFNFPFRDSCQYDVSGFGCKVPDGHYLVMGDNRDNSLDSRVWGFVPDANLVGRAFFIWMNYSDFSSDFSRLGVFK